MLCSVRCFRRTTPNCPTKTPTTDAATTSMRPPPPTSTSVADVNRVRPRPDPVARLERDGWHSPRSVLMFVTDDIPFLVDTVRLVLDRHDLGIHLLVHPTLIVSATRTA